LLKFDFNRVYFTPSRPINQKKRLALLKFKEKDGATHNQWEGEEGGKVIGKRYASPKRQNRLEGNPFCASKRSEEVETYAHFNLTIRHFFELSIVLFAFFLKFLYIGNNDSPREGEKREVSLYVYCRGFYGKKPEARRGLWQSSRKSA